MDPAGVSEANRRLRGFDSTDSKVEMRGMRCRGHTPNSNMPPLWTSHFTAVERGFGW